MDIWQIMSDIGGSLWFRLGTSFIAGLYFPDFIKDLIKLFRRK